MTAASMPPNAAERRPWRRGLAWLAFLGPFFYLSYGLSNHLAAMRTAVPSVVFAWEHAIPFVAWTIVPYWSINAFYVASLFVHRHAAAVDLQARRLLTAQLIAVTCFLVWPLRFAFERPETQGLPGLMFDALTSFDRPFNQAPSLHIALLVILWAVYAPRLGGAWRAALHGWFLLIGVSVLTTWQHHVIDIPTGALLGAFCLWLWPEGRASPLQAWRKATQPKAWRLAGAYALGSLIATALALSGGGFALWLLWPAISLLLVALAYAGLGDAVFQKQANGHLAGAAQWLLAPYLLGARLNQWAWTHRLAPEREVADGVWLGRVPRAGERPAAGTALVDLSAELHAPNAHGVCLPTLDLLPPQPALLRNAAAHIDRLRQQGPVRVACALGFSRSACAVATWLLRSRRVPDLDTALACIAKAQPRMVIDAGQRAAILEAAR